MRRTGLALSLSAVALAVNTSSAGAVQIGQLGAVQSPANCASQVDRVQPTVTSGTSYVVPSPAGVTNWTVRSWGTLANAAGQVKMKMYRPLGPGVFTAVAQDVTRTLTANILQTFPVSLEVRSGDVLGLNAVTDYPCSFVLAGDSYLRTGTGVISDLTNGQTGTFPEAVADRRLDLIADVTPTNTLTLGAAKTDASKGTAELAVTVPNAGAVDVDGTDVKGSATAIGAGTVKVLISATGNKKSKLKKKGKATVNPSVTFTPTGGAASTPATTSIKLVKSKKKKKK